MPLINPFFRLPGRWSRRRARRGRMALQLTLLSIILLIVLPVYLIYKPPKPLIAYFQRRFPTVLFQIPTTSPLVALTIDDTPSQYTRQILETLKDNDAHATFFVIGSQVPGREAILEEIVRAGHDLGNHAMHDEPSISLPSDVLSNEIQRVDAFINAAYASAGVARSHHFFRPGSGVFSQRVLDIVEKAGYRTILGSIYPHDPFISWPKVNAWHVLSMLRPGAVIICHDRRSWTVPMLRRVLPQMQRRGYAAVSVSEMLGGGEG